MSDMGSILVTVTGMALLSSRLRIQAISFLARQWPQPLHSDERGAIAPASARQGS
jgi:hypothetical protein